MGARKTKAFLAGLTKGPEKPYVSSTITYPPASYIPQNISQSSELKFMKLIDSANRIERLRMLHKWINKSIAIDDNVKANLIAIVEIKMALYDTK